MATQVDCLNRGGSFESFRPWRHRDSAAAAGHAASQKTVQDGDCTEDISVSTALRQVSTVVNVNIDNVVKRQRPPPSQKENGRPGAQPLVSSPSPPLSESPPSSSPSHAQASRLSDDVADAPRSPSPPTATSLAEDESDNPEPAPSAIKQSGSRPLPINDSPPEVGQNSPRPSLKRRRALSDVDGPNTAALCCKKRRLRRFLITSRLSQPFSQPATHILNRESVASGDKRFLKLAAIMNARRITRQSSTMPVHLPCPNEVLRRAAMANRLRRRLYAEAASGRSIVGAPLQLMTNARFTIVPVATAGTPATPSASAAEVASSAVFTTTGPVSISGMPGTRLAWKPAFIKSSLAGGGEPSSHHGHGPPQLMGCMIGFVRNTGGPAGGAGNLKIVRAISRSPKLRPVRDQTAVPQLHQDDHSRQEVEDDAESLCFEGGNYGDDDLDDYGGDDDNRDCAFPTSEHESRYEANDDPEDVYSDFSVLFSAATGNNEGSADWNEDGLDDYMDELDGIAHLPR